VPSVSATGKDAGRTSTTTIDVSRIQPPHVPAAIVQQTPASCPPLTATSTDVGTSADTADTARPERLWDRAYDDLKKEETALVEAYEKILSRKLHGHGFSSPVDESEQNTIAQDDVDTRRSQMKQLVHTGLDKTAREAKVKDAVGVAMQVVLSANSLISAAIQAMPQAALAWTGVCVALEVSPPGHRELGRLTLFGDAPKPDRADRCQPQWYPLRYPQDGLVLELVEHSPQGRHRPWH